jgi:hypothetical protein
MAAREGSDDLNMLETSGPFGRHAVITCVCGDLRRDIPSITATFERMSFSRRSKLRGEEPLLPVLILADDVAQKAHKLVKEIEKATVNVTKTHPRAFHRHLTS